LAFAEFVRERAALQSEDVDLFYVGSKTHDLYGRLGLGR